MLLLYTRNFCSTNSASLYVLISYLPAKLYKIKVKYRVCPLVIAYILHNLCHPHTTCFCCWNSCRYLLVLSYLLLSKSFTLADFIFNPRVSSSLVTNMFVAMCLRCLLCVTRIFTLYVPSAFLWWAYTTALNVVLIILQVNCGTFEPHLPQK